MNFKQMFLGGLATAGLGFLWVACSSNATGSSCVIGAESCSCQTGGQCDPGLACLSQRCVRLGGSSGSAGAAGSTTTNTAGAGGSGPGGSTGSAGAGMTGGAPPGTGGMGAGGSRAGAGGTGGRAGAGGAGGSGGGVAGSGGAGGAPGTSTLGAACKANTDCSAGLSCLKSSDNISAAAIGGPGNGLCTLDCTANQNACGPVGGICAAIDVTPADVITRALCFESCAIGPTRPLPPVAKCHGREDVVCRPFNAAETVFGCFPLCVTDADCGTRKCEAASGMCVDVPQTGKTVGSACTSAGDTLSSTECAGGVCLPIEAVPDGGTAPGICSSLCSLGSTRACGLRMGALNAGPPVGACIFPWGDMGYNSGDLGLCLQLCDTPNDCSYRSANWTCRTDIPVAGSGHAVCLPPLRD
jgi:hypothetical protein